MEQNLISVRSMYSIDSGLHSPETLAKYVSENTSFDYLPLTESHNFFSFVKHRKACEKYSLKPIYGVDLYVKDFGHVTVLAKDNEGFRCLKVISSVAHDNKYDSGELCVSVSDLLALPKSSVLLFISSESYFSPVSRDSLLSVEDGLGFYVKINPYEYEGDFCENAKFVCTSDVLFCSPEDKFSHDVRVSIKEKSLISDFESQCGFYNSFVPPSDFASQCSGLEKFDFISVQGLYADCNVCFELGIVELPRFPFHEYDSEEDALVAIVNNLYESRIGNILKANPRNAKAEYESRLKEELSVITEMGFAGYFLVVWDYIAWSRENGVMVGPGRGSGVGSFVAYLLDIITIDPLKYDLLFERFLNKDRISMPDFDIDFCSQGRDRVIDYVKRKHGDDVAAQICTFSVMGGRSAIKDIARVYGINADKVAAAIPAVPNISFEQAIEQSPKFKEYAESSKYSEIVRVAVTLEGVIRQVGRHAGGVVIAKNTLDNSCGLFRDPKTGARSVMVDMGDAEDLGLVKFDFLGLANLTVIDRTLKDLSSRGVDIDINNIPLDDPEVFAFLRKCHTQAVFQLTSSGMRNLIKQQKTSTFEDLIALLALFRPGPLQSKMVDNFIARKMGQEEVSYPDAKYQHASLEDVLSPTYGIILYQEQVMKIAQVLAGYSLGQADILRRAMGKKKPEEMELQRKTFCDGAASNNIDPVLAEKIFHIVEKFSGYGFNKSHSAAYAMISYQTLYLKAKYPAIFMASALTNDFGDHEKLKLMMQELGSYGLTIEPPCVNSSKSEFVAVDDATIMYGLNAVKGLGTDFTLELIKERESGGVFSSFDDFVSRIVDKIANKSQFLALVFSGALDELADFYTLLKFVEDKYGFDKIKYAIATDSESKEFNVAKACGLSFKLLSSVGAFADEMALAKCVSLSDIDSIPNGSKIVIGGLVQNVKVIPGPKVNRLVAKVRDLTGDADLVGWSEFINAYADGFDSDHLYLLEVSVGSYNGAKQLTLLRAWGKDFVRRHFGLDA